MTDELSHVVAYAAWLQAPVNEQSDETRLQRLLAEQKRTKTEPPELASQPEPPLCARHLYDALFEVGPVAQTGMGMRPLTFTDIGVWAGLIGWDLTPWEARTLVSLSGVFLAEYEQARKGGPAPRREELTDEEKASVAQGLADLLRRNAKRSKRNGR